MSSLRFTTTSGAVFEGAQIGTYGAIGDLSWTTRWGSGACGMFEASWTMPLPPNFEHSALRRGTLVEIVESGWRIGSSLILNEPSRGAGIDSPWQFTASGVGREAEGENSFYALDGAMNTTAVPSTAVDTAIARGLPWAGRDASVPIAQVGSSATSDGLFSVGTLLSAAADGLGQRWGVGADNRVRFYSDPVTPALQTAPGVGVLGAADDDYASVVLVRYIDSSSGMLTTVAATDLNSSTAYRRREFPVDLTGQGPIATAVAQGYANGILAKSKGRLGWANGLTLTSNDLLTVGGQPAVLNMVEAGQMVRIHGVFNDLLEYNGYTWLDIIIGEAKYADGAQTIDINPLGLAARDLASVVEEVTGIAMDGAA